MRPTRLEEKDSKLTTLVSSRRHRLLSQGLIVLAPVGSGRPGLTDEPHLLETRRCFLCWLCPRVPVAHSVPSAAHAQALSLPALTCHPHLLLAPAHVLAAEGLQA